MMHVAWRHVTWRLLQRQQRGCQHGAHVGAREQAKPFQAPSWWRASAPDPEAASGARAMSPSARDRDAAEVARAPEGAPQQDELMLLQKQRERWAAFAGAQGSQV
jgi:hypothetical protein